MSKYLITGATGGLGSSAVAHLSKDVDIFEVDDLKALEIKLLKVPGIVETGLFLDTTSLIIVGKEDGPEIKKR